MLYVPTPPLPDNSGHVAEWPHANETSNMATPFERTPDELEPMVSENYNPEVAQEYDMQSCQGTCHCHGSASELCIQNMAPYKSDLQEYWKIHEQQDEGPAASASQLSCLQPTPFDLTAPPMNSSGKLHSNHHDYYSQQLAMDPLFEVATRTFYATMDKFSRQTSAEYERRTTYTFLENWHLHSMYSKAQQILLGMSNVQPVVFLSGDDLMFTPPIVQPDAFMNEYYQTHVDWEDETGYENYQYDMQCAQEYGVGESVSQENRYMPMSGPSQSHVNSYKGSENDITGDYRQKPFDQCTHSCCQYHNVSDDVPHSAELNSSMMMSEDAWIRQYCQQQEMQRCQPSSLNGANNVACSIPASSSQEQLQEQQGDHPVYSETEWFERFILGNQHPMASMGDLENQLEHSYEALPQVLKSLQNTIDPEGSVTISPSGSFLQTGHDSKRTPDAIQENASCMADELLSSEDSETETDIERDEPSDTVDFTRSYESLEIAMAQPSSVATPDTLLNISEQGYGTVALTRNAEQRIGHESAYHMFPGRLGGWSDSFVDFILYVLSISEAFVNKEADVDRQERGESIGVKATGKASRFMRCVVSLWYVLIVCAESILYFAIHPKPARPIG